MFRNHIKVAIRNLLKNKAHASINIVGLSTGMAVAMLIGLWIYDELSYNTVHENYNSIAKIRQHVSVNGEINTDKAVPFPLATELRTNYSNYFKYIVLSSNRAGHILSVGNKKLSHHGVYLEPQAPDMFSLHMLKGSRNGLQDPSSILLSKSAASAFLEMPIPLTSSCGSITKKK
ncbi:ABC transporter permease [Paraflavitalea speifideaquila]|uniref:ABC transporter permease n=1 Tax=Paraflavitalea speifideaquila TaxID=3076558 RepID=UPI0028E8E6FA|nr:ABC transporter permease [Paraflavitalea speifideiaquila]